MWIEESWAPIVLSSFGGASTGFRPGDDVDYLAGTQRFMGAASEKANLGLRFALALAMLSPFWLSLRLSTLRGLSSEARAAMMKRLLDHPIFLVRELMLLLKLVACMAIFRSADARARTTYDGPSPASTGRRQRALPVLPAAAQEVA